MLKSIITFPCQNLFYRGYFKSCLDVKCDEYKNNYQALQNLVEDLNVKSKSVSLGGSEKARNKHVSAGKLLVRHRISRLLDVGSPFLEISPLAALSLGDEFPGAGMVAGIGYVSRCLSLIAANDATVKGGTYHPLTVKKHLRSQEIAEKHRLPCIYLVDSGGAYLPLQSEVFPDKNHFGRIFYNQARLSSIGVPQIAVVMGSCTAGGAYVPAMADASIIVDKKGAIFLAGPPLVKAATGEVVSVEELGGGRMHCSESGVTDWLASDDQEAIDICRNTMSMFCNSQTHTLSHQNHDPPLYDAKEIYGIVGTNILKPYDVREVVARIVDASEFEEFKELYGKTIFTAWAKVKGKVIGVVANNGILFSESALKAAHFIQICSKLRIPLLFLQNISGFMVGKEAESQGIAKSGAKMVNAVSCSNVPKITIIIGGSYGAGNYGMCGRAYDPNFLFMWPNAKICVMGAAQANFVLSTVSKKLKDKDSDLKEIFEKESTAYFSTSNIWDDGIIDPSNTRSIIAMCLKVFDHQAKFVTQKTNFGVFRM